MIVSMRSEGKIEWLQEIGLIIKQRLMPPMAQLDGIIINIWKNRKVHSDEKLYVLLEKFTQRVA